MHEVVVVGGGVGGLTMAALLAARGVGVCLIERASRVGGCCASFEAFGYTFEQGAGLYAGWGPGGIHERVFAELPVEPPRVSPLSPAYSVRMPEGDDVRVGGTLEDFVEVLRASFPECADSAADFYNEALKLADALERAARRFPALTSTTKLERLRLAASGPRVFPRILAAREETAARRLSKASARFRRFVDAQLQIYAQAASEECSYLYAAVALAQPFRGMHAIGGGAQALADSLAESVRRSGGTLRLDSTALRVALDARGRAVGVDLISGERVEASRAVVSNLTVWDTYGKLLGADRTPSDVRTRLKELRGRGAYQVFLSLDEEAARRLPAEHVLALGRSSEGDAFDTEDAPLMLGTAPAWDSRAPVGKRAATVSTFTDAEQWFTFHSDESEHEEQDQRTLESVWTRLHASLHELGSGAEVIETSTPRAVYELTRRRLGMSGTTPRTPHALLSELQTHKTHVPNLYLTGDTVFPGNGLAAVTHSALIVANEIAPPGRVGRGRGD
ncbi:MAG TPA: FAD-dependent oxidoreductase [Pyrinomonadaceae bacterium]|jgi:C-3',4' desaturase CrtD|nr:FAD-dependent oxidoreductase [Pyrinomonadaceae bacterium]